MTGDEIKNSVRNAVFLGSAAMFGALPMFYWQFGHLTGSIFMRQPDPNRIWYLALSQSFLLLGPALLCSLVGFLYAKPCGLPGFGNYSDIGFWLPVGLISGMILTPIRYITFDRTLMTLIPDVFPRHWPWAVAQMIGGALAQEVILRFGLLTIGVCLMRRLNVHNRRWLCLAVISIFGSAGSYLTLLKFNLAHRLPTSHLAELLIVAFCFQWLFGEIYIRKGFIAAVSLHAGLAVKFLVYALMLDSS